LFMGLQVNSGFPFLAIGPTGTGKSMFVNEVLLARIFNTTLVSGVALGAVLAIPGFALAAFSDRLFRVPLQIADETRLLFVLATVAFFLTVASTAFQLVSQARNRLDCHNTVSLLHRITRVAVTVGVFVWISPSLVAAGWALVAAALVEFVGHVVCWRKIGPDLTISPSRVVFPAFRGTGWVALSTLGAFLFFGADTLLVNRLLGPEETTRYALALQWGIFLRMFASAISGTFHPATLRLSAGGDAERLCEHIQRAIKFTGYTTAIGAAILAAFAVPFLELWLGQEYRDLATLVTILVAPAGVIFAVVPMYSIALAANRVRIPALATVGFGLSSVVAIVGFAGELEMGLVAVAAVVTLAIFLYNIAFTPLYTASILKVNSWWLYAGIAKVAVASLLFFGVAKGAESLVSPESWWTLIVTGAVLGGLFFAMTLAAGLNAHDRAALKNWLAAR
ncbi:MAG: oligosaccharide flippase family protein, partial [Verrucomicrobiota bacterium]